MFQYYQSMQQESTVKERAANLLPPWNLSFTDNQYLASAFEFSFSFLNGARGNTHFWYHLHLQAAYLLNWIQA